MSDAPDQIWIDRNGGNWSPCSGGTQDVEYRRADLPPTISAAMELPEVRALVDAATPFVSPVQNADYARQLRQHDALVAALAAWEAAQ